VNLFLNKKISFLKMMELIKENFSKYRYKEINNTQDIFNADELARELILSYN